MRILALTTILFVVFGAAASAQIIGPGPSKHRLELGGYYGEEHYDRKFIRRYSSGGRGVYTANNLSDENAAATLRYGITDRLYVILNFGTIQSESDYLNGRNGLMGILGTGLNVKFAQFRGVFIRLSGQYNDSFVMDPDFGVPAWRARGAEVVLAGDRPIRMNRTFTLILGAGLRSYYSNSRYRLNPDTLVYSKNVHYQSLATLVQCHLVERIVIGFETMLGSDTEWRLRAGVVI